MLRSIFTRTAKYVLRRAGYEIRKINLPVLVIPDQPPWVHEIIARVQPYTFTSPERIASLCNASHLCVMLSNISSAVIFPAILSNVESGRGEA